MKKITKIFVFALIAVMLFGTVNAFAFEPYETYTYSIDGEPLKSPMAYRAEGVFNELDMGIDKLDPSTPKLVSASDVVADNEGNIYIADKGNNRIVVLDKYYKAKHIIKSYIDENNSSQTLSGPYGVFVTNPEITASGESYIYVADTGNYRVVVFEDRKSVV